MMNQSILIYGAGNCEIAGALEYELNQITQIKEPDIKILAKGYLFNNSCMAMYRRFKNIKDHVKEVARGGVQEYFYEGHETVKTCELKMSPVSEKVFEDFLKMGFEKFSEDDIILILIGQGHFEGLFLDFSQSPISYISYERIFSIIEETAKGKVKKLSLILDISHWHNVYMPLHLSKYHLIDGAFIYERESALKIFPICTWIHQALSKESHWLEATCGIMKGYKIDPHAIWWDLCVKKWEEYVKFPSGKSFEAFYNIYKKIVIYQGDSQRIYSKVLRERGIRCTSPMTLKDIQKYFEVEYVFESQKDEIEKWLSELKICTDYYK